MVISYKQIIERIQILIETHQQFMDMACYVGRDYEAIEDGRNEVFFPLLQITPVGADFIHSTESSATSYPTTTFNLKLRVLDKVMKNEENKIDVYSQTHLIIGNIINLISHHQWFGDNDLKIISTVVSCIPEEYNNTHFACGWATNVVFQIRNWNGVCGQPFEDSDKFNPVLEKAYYDLLNSLGNSIGTGTLTANTTTHILAPDANVQVVYSDNQELIFSGSVPSSETETIEIDRQACADATAYLIDTVGVAINTTTIPAGNSENIVAPNAKVIVNRDGSLFTSQLIRSNQESTIDVVSAVSEGWNPPSDWDWEAKKAATPANGFTILMPVFEKSLNLFTFTCWFVGTGTVNFNDGTGNHTVTDGTRFDYAVDYANISTTVTSRGYKLTPVVFTSTGDFTRISFNAKHPQQLWYVAQAMKALKVNTTTAGKFTYSSNNDNAQWMEILDFGTKNIAAPYLLYNHIGINELVCTISGSGDMYNMFANANLANINVCEFDYSGFSNLEGLFQGAFGGDGRIFNGNIAACTNISSMLRANQIFGEVHLTNAGLNTSLNYLINNSPVRVLTIDNCSSVTSTVGFVVDYGHLQALEWLELHGLRVGINLSLLPLTATALNAFFTSLGTASGSQTIVVTGCIGAATCDTSIATAKGFTVTT